METLFAVSGFLKSVVTAAIIQFFWLFGLLFVFGFALYLFARMTRTVFVNTIGSKADIYFTGWVGTPVHELGHALFCVIFRHKITGMKLYHPNPDDGTIGFVNHSFNTKSLYQQSGNFFIGIGPVISGTLALYAVLYFLVPNYSEVFVHLKAQSEVWTNLLKGHFQGVFSAIFSSLYATLSTLFIKENMTDYRFYIFLYLALCISSHMELSPPDIKGAWLGMVWLLLAFFLFNLFVLGFEHMGWNQYVGKAWLYFKPETYAAPVGHFLGNCGSILMFSLFISTISFLFTYVVLTIINLLRNKGFVSPF